MPVHNFLSYFAAILFIIILIKSSGGIASSPLIFGRSSIDRITEFKMNIFPIE